MFPAPTGWPRRYPPTSHCVSAKQAMLFAQAIGTPYAAVDAAPPMAQVMMTLPHGVARIMQDAACVGDVSRLMHAVHLEEDITWYEALPTDAPLWVVPALDNIAEWSNGEAFYLRTEIHDRAGRLLCETRSTVLIRERKPGIRGPPQTPRALGASPVGGLLVGCRSTNPSATRRPAATTTPSIWTTPWRARWA